MCEPKDSSQLKAWLFNEEDLELCRTHANRTGRKYIHELAVVAGAPTTTTTSSNSSSGTDPSGNVIPTTATSTNDVVVETTTSSTNTNNNKGSSSALLATTVNPKVECFAREFVKKKNDTLFAAKVGNNNNDDKDDDDGPWETIDGNPYLTPTEEATLVSFYVSKLPKLIGPQADVPRLRRESKVPATASMLLLRFYLSNSVMVHDPKTVMVSAAFLASKVEDAMTDVKYLEDGTKMMGAPVTMNEIIPAELNLLEGINFELLCFHPYKAVLAITEDLRTYLKSERGRSLVTFSGPNHDHRQIVGQDLKPMHDAAQDIINDVIVSDIPLLYSPGQIGLAALMVANDQQRNNENNNNNNENDIPHIDLIGYLSHRFDDADVGKMTSVLREICTKLLELKDGKHGCDVYNTDMEKLKSIHKKLKKCRLWGQKEKKQKKKKGSSDADNHDDGPDRKKSKLE